MSSNLLVVDFDYFFVNKLEGGHLNDEAFMFYDWGHLENEMFRTHIWPSRAAGFIRSGLELPGVEIPTDWWARFDIDPDATCSVSDSNAYSGAMEAEDSYDHVWLFDAHHDLYRIKTLRQVDEWASQNRLSCEDWMFAHYLRGSALHWRWPQWHRLAAAMAEEIPDWVNCDARADDMAPVNVRFDAVSICRSGCWVPPWCDSDFYQLVMGCPVREIVEVEDGALEQRQWEQATDLSLNAYMQLGGIKAK